ncbi:hypothetical protein O181_049125 [Austropuccinia psidii MF-1]|uniref:Peptidase A2 domain-containing protein n=1 Tax=Austropuccinia psidii MF-1 TaxID=1389203 RepID=A0A9Q3HPS1_9BASI|nr:hypothetical protein [Austropuccinia psidii MF-1]
MHYSCPLGMIEVSVGQEGHIVKALVDTGADLSIIPEVESIKARLPMRVLNMRLRGIGGHSTAIVGLSENSPLVLPSGDERRIHFFLASGAVHIVIGRPFLSVNTLNNKVKFSAIKNLMEEDCAYQYLHHIQKDCTQDHQEEWQCVTWAE